MTHFLWFSCGFSLALVYERATARYRHSAMGVLGGSHGLGSRVLSHLTDPIMLPYWLQHILVEWPWLQRIFFRYRCPYPIDGNRSARACFMAGHCGCDNQNRFR